jgi:hypothetical protein
MKKYFSFLLIILFGLVFILFSVQDTPVSNHGDLKKNPFSGNIQRPNLTKNRDFGNAPIYFVQNQGQVNERVRFYAKTPRCTLWITREGLMFAGIRNVAGLIFQNANKNPEIIPLEITRYKVNYFKSIKSDWKTNIPTSKAVLYKNIYKGIDFKVYGVENQVEYDWLVKPGCDPSQIKFSFTNDGNKKIDKQGNLVIYTEFGELIHKKPEAYQHSAPNVMKKVEVRFKKIKRNVFTFDIENYDRNSELVIDPVVLVYSTYLGGTDFDQGFGIFVDSQGFAYVVGSTSSPDFPTVVPYQDVSHSNSDVFVTKFSPDGQRLVYSTYLGGQGNDYGFGIVVDASGFIVVTGITGSDDFPTKNAYQGSLRGWGDVFVAKFSPDGSSLIYSTYLGGSNHDSLEAVTIDSSNCVYLMGYTYSSDFPTKNAFQENIAGEGDAFVAKFSPDGVPMFSTYLGGSEWEEGFGIAVDNSDCIYLTGRTSSIDFPTKNAYQETFAGDVDVFVTKFSPDGGKLLYSTYLGGSDFDDGESIAVDSSNCVYLTGYTKSTDFPVYHAIQDILGGEYYYDAFVAKLSPDGMSLVYSTYLGGQNTDGGHSIKVDTDGSVYVAGPTTSEDFPVKNACQNNYGGYCDAFVTKFSPDFQTILYSTYLGGSDNDSSYQIDVDNKGYVYFVGFTLSHDFPLKKPYQINNKGITNAFVSKLTFDYPPKITITSPHTNDLVNGTTPVNLEAKDDVKLSLIELYIDGQLKKTIECASKSSHKAVNRGLNVSSTIKSNAAITGKSFKYTYNWDTKAYSYGFHTIKAVAYDTYNQADLDRIKVKVDQFPLITFIEPENGAMVHSSVDVSVTASDDDIVRDVYFFINGVLVKTLNHTPYSFVLNTLDLGNGFNTIKAAAYDSANRVSTDEIEIDVQNLVLSLEVTKATESAWLIKKQYVKIELRIENKASIPVDKYIIYRKEGSGTYQSIKEVPSSELPHGVYTYSDLVAGNNKTYTYKVSALAASGTIIATSNERSIVFI